MAECQEDENTDTVKKEAYYMSVTVKITQTENH